MVGLARMFQCRERLEWDFYMQAETGLNVKLNPFQCRERLE